MLNLKESPSGLAEQAPAPPRNAGPTAAMSAPHSSRRSAGESARAAICLRDVWKIFGDREAEAFKAMRDDGLGKADVMRRFDSVVGIQGVSLEVRSGEIFC